MSHNELSPNAQDYVKVVWNEAEWSDDPVTTKRLAERLGVGASTVSDQVRKLCDQGLLDHAPYGAISLTVTGWRHAVAMVRRHRLIETFLVEILGYGWDEIHDEAEVLEHACSERMIDAIDAQLGFPIRDPHGDPIPRADGSIEAPQATPLRDAEAGAWRIARVSDADPDRLRRFAKTGVIPDAQVEVPGGDAAVTVLSSGQRIDIHDRPAVWVRPE